MRQGVLFAEDISMGDTCFDHYKKVGVHPGAEILTLDQAYKRFPVFKNAN